MVVEPETTEVKNWQGLHLFHFGMSNCSQRVRIMLEEDAFFDGQSVQYIDGRQRSFWLIPRPMSSTD